MKSGRELYDELRSKFCWHANAFFVRRPHLLNTFQLTLTIVDGFGTPGDTILTSIVCRTLKQLYPKLRINCVTPNPELIAYDPDINFLNERKTFFNCTFDYLDIIN